MNASIVIDEEAGTKTVKVTKRAFLTLKPNPKSTILMRIPFHTDVEGTLKWTGRIDPPLIQSKSLIPREGADISGTKRKLERKDVVVIVKAGSGSSTLKFTNEITIEVPVNLAHRSIVNLYSSENGKIWESMGSRVILDRMLVIRSRQLSYFAVEVEKEKLLRETAPKVVTFNDIKGHWAENYIRDLAAAGVISGKSAGVFAPNDTINRAELMKIVSKAFKLDVPATVSTTSYSDVAPLAWYAPYVEAMTQAGWVKGYPLAPGLRAAAHKPAFKPNQMVNRVEALKILLEAAEVELPSITRVYYKDTIADAWYIKYVDFAENNNILIGFDGGTYAPSRNLTRAEAARMVVKLLELK